MTQVPDTVYILVGRIGKENLSSQAIKKLKGLDEYHDALINLEKAFDEADDKDKAKYEKKVQDKRKFIDGYEADFLSFLQDEEKDIIVRTEKAQAQAQKKAEKEEAERQQVELEKQERAAKQEEERLAREEEQRLAKEEEERVAAEEAEKLEKEKKAEKQSEETDPKKQKNLAGIVLGGIAVAAGLFFGINWMKNR